jgi:hypothetical protein
MCLMHHALYRFLDKAGTVVARHDYGYQIRNVLPGHVNLSE